MESSLCDNIYCDCNFIYLNPFDVWYFKQFKLLEKDLILIF